MKQVNCGPFLRTCLIIMMILLILLGCQGTQQVKTKKEVPKPTKEGAERLSTKYWELMNSGDYANAYEPVSPEDRRLVSKDLFVRKHKETDAGRELSQPKTEITSIKLKGNRAEMTISHDVLGVLIPLDETLVFIEGKWYVTMQNPSYYTESPAMEP